MTDHANSPSIAALRKLEATLHQDHQIRAAKQTEKVSGGRRRALGSAMRGMFGGLARRRWARRCFFMSAGLSAILLLGCVALWMRLLSGPIALDLATPWLTAAIEENFGRQQQVEVGGTQLERDSSTGRIAIRIRDIVVRDPDGTVVASAPKAEVGLSGSGLMSGRLRAESLSLVGAELAVRIEKGGEVTVFAGADKRPFATAAAAPAGPVAAPPAQPSDAATSAAEPSAARTGMTELTAALAWIDGVSKTGLDGHELGQLGLKNGNLTVDDQRSGKRWTFENINLALTRPAGGGVAFTISAEDPLRPWVLTASMTPRPDGRRAVQLEARKVSLKDVLLALRVGDGSIRADVPISASLRGEIGANGMPETLSGRIVADAGTIGLPDDPATQLAVERAEFNLDWDATRNALVVPFQVLAGGHRITLLARLDVPRDGTGPWTFGLTGGTVVVAGAPGDDHLILNRIAARVKYDHAEQRLVLEQGEFGNTEIGIALSGGIDNIGGDPRIAIGVAGTRMKMSTLKRLWPAFVATHVREWVVERALGGTVERVVIATNAPLSTLKADGPPIPKDGLSIEITANGTELQVIDGLPSIRDADLHVQVSARTAQIGISRATVELSSGRKLAISNGIFEVPDTHPKEPPARVRFRLDGPVPAAAELLSLDRLRDPAGASFDPATTRGTISAQIGLGMPLRNSIQRETTSYNVGADISNFVAEKMVMGQKVEATTLRVSASNDGYQIKGDVKIGGTPAVLDYHKNKGATEPEVKLETTLDDAARAKLGIDFGGAVAGPIAIRVGGQLGTDDRDSRLGVEADLTQAKIEHLFPGWVKAAGRPAKAKFILIGKDKGTRFEDLAIEGGGVTVRGSVELDSSGDVVNANFPVFGVSDGDKSSLKVERDKEGTLKVTMRGDVYDGRNFVKSSVSGAEPDQKSKAKAAVNVDLDIKLGAVVGYHGEALRGIELKLSRRAGKIRSFAMNAKIGSEGTLVGDMRGRSAARQVIYFETQDAGALFRFTDVYPRMMGGQMWVAMDPPGPDATPQEGLLNIRDFAIKGEAALDRVVSGAPSSQNTGVEFSRMRVEFNRRPGKLTIRDGVVRGPIVGATIEGQLDYLKNEVHMRGTFVPLYGLNNVFGQLPIVGLFLGGSNEGLVGITYEVVGQPGAPVLRVNPISAVAPGLLRKFFEFPGSNGATERAPGAGPGSPTGLVEQQMRQN
ncbi:MAG: hypothetical protein JWN71_2046 [Xanthobacteraceae bacterium]|nr:hypothetical protein [Xanthobacteraceae bacterium]